MLYLYVVVIVTSLKQATSTCKADGECQPRCVNMTSSGECFQCQNSRFYGKRCENVCPESCLNSRCHVNNSRVVCTDGCVAGKKGDNCIADCPSGCTQCERYGDRCIKCKGHLYGTHCKNVCPYNCKNSLCHLINSSVVCTEGCVIGKKGGNCSADCPSACVHCERYDDKCIGPCLSIQYYGNTCEKLCPGNCRNGCNRDTGNCNSCEEGYTSRHCNETCPINCRGGCEILSGKCVRCKVGYEGKYCDRCETLGCKEGNNTTPTIIYSLLAVVILLGSALVVAVLMGLRHKRRKILKTKSRVEVDQQPFDTSDQSYRTQYWASKYWEIDDNDLDSDSFSNNRASCAQPLQNREENDSTCLNLNDYQQHSGTDIVMENQIYTSAENCGACGFSTDAAIRSSDEPQIQREDDRQPIQAEMTDEEISVCSVMSEDLRLTRKTESMIIWEQNIDSKTYVKYISANLTDDSVK